MATSHSRCERNLSKITTAQFLGNGGRHCPDCDRDSIGKRLLVLNYLRRQDEALLESDMSDEESLFVAINGSNFEGGDEDFEIPDSPLLADMDDFQDGQAGEEVVNIGGEFNNCLHLSLF